MTPPRLPLAAAAFAVAAVLAPTPAAAAPCAGFDDVDASNPFCANIEWVRNRKVTLGCALSQYCPTQPVSRAQMAAFMNRLGTALTPLVVDVEAASAAIALDGQPVVCQTADQALADFPRRALVDATLSGTAPAGVDIGVRAVYSTDAGATWLPLHAVEPVAFVPPNQWGQGHDLGVVDLPAGATVRFGVRAARNGPGTTNLADSRCRVRAAIRSRDGSSSPF